MTVETSMNPASASSWRQCSTLVHTPNLRPSFSFQASLDQENTAAPWGPVSSCSKRQAGSAAACAIHSSMRAQLRLLEALAVLRLGAQKQQHKERAVRADEWARQAQTALLGSLSPLQRGSVTQHAQA